MNYFKNCFHILILSAVIGIYTNVLNADLFKTNLGISNWSSDTTLKGFSNTDNEKFRNHNKKQTLLTICLIIFALPSWGKLYMCNKKINIFLKNLF